MKCWIQTTPYYFGTDVWHLCVEFGGKKGYLKMFYLGQDVKYCYRIMGGTLTEVLKETRIKKIETHKERVKLGNFIIRTLGLTSKDLKEIETWDLACE